MKFLLIVLWYSGTSYIAVGQSTLRSGPAELVDTAQKQIHRPKLLRLEQESYMVWQVKHISDFIARFNHEVLHQGKKLIDTTRPEHPREISLRRLFNEEDERFKRTKYGIQSYYASQVDEFINTVTVQNLRICKQPHTEAVARLRVRHHSLSDTLVVRLRKFYTVDSASYWKITQVHRPRLLQYTVHSTCDSLEAQEDLPPNSHEVHFLPLLRGLIDYQSFCPFMSSSSTPDLEWQHTEAALRKGVLQVESVLSTTIYMSVGTEWQLELREFLQEKENSGWLISNLVRQPQDQSLNR